MTLAGDNSATSAAAPIRTCVGCRARDAQARLLRFTRRSDGRVVPALVTRDVAHGDAVGRSAYLCPRRACFDQALQRRAFVRAFSGNRRRVSVVSVTDIDAEALWAATAEQLRCEIGLLARTSENPHAHLRRRGLEQLLFELSSPPQPPSRSVALASAKDELTRKGGAPSHG